MKESLPLYILLPTNNRFDLLKRSVDSIQKARKPSNYRETIIIENGTPKTSENITSLFPDDLRLKYVYQENGNKSAALNFVIKNLISEDNAIILFLDDDVRFDKDLILQYMKAVGDNRRGFYYGGPVDIDLEGVKPPEHWWKHFPNSHTGWHPDGKFGDNDIMYFLGYNWLAFKKDITEAGGFNEELGPGSQFDVHGQESRMQSKLLDYGVKPFYVPNALVWHFITKEQMTTEFLIKRCLKQGRTSWFNKDRNLNVFQYLTRKSTILLRVIYFWSLKLINVCNKEKAAYYTVKYYRWFGRLIGNTR